MDPTMEDQLEIIEGNCEALGVGEPGNGLKVPERVTVSLQSKNFQLLTTHSIFLLPHYFLFDNNHLKYSKPHQRTNYQLNHSNKAPNPQTVTPELDIRFHINAMAHAKALVAEEGLSRADTA